MIQPRTERLSFDSGSDTVPTIPIARPGWMADALCLEPDARATVGMHFVDAERFKDAAAAALQVCGRCLCRDACLEYALADPTIVGIWGGADTAARKAIRTNRQRQMEATPYAAS